MLVQVQAAGLNVVDEKIRAGAFKSFLRYELPQVMGSDVAGTVIGVGAKVWAFALGDQVYAQLRTDRIGTFAERIAVPEADVALKPATVTLEEAGSLPLVARNRRNPGVNFIHMASIRKTPCAAARPNRSATSAAFIAIGFSTSTCLAASRASRLMMWWVANGVAR